jgi:hypothetical protein
MATCISRNYLGSYPESLTYSGNTGSNLQNWVPAQNWVERCWVGTTLAGKNRWSWLVRTGSKPRLIFQTWNHNVRVSGLDPEPSSQLCIYVWSPNCETHLIVKKLNVTRTGDWPVVIHQFKCRLVRTGSKAGLIFKNPKSKPEIFLDEPGPELDCRVRPYMCATRTGTERPVPSF